MPRDSRSLSIAVLAAAVVLGGGLGGAVQNATVARPQTPKDMRLYVFDCGVLSFTTEGVERYRV